MASSVFNFTTGPSTLPDVGVLYYNGCLFSPLFETSISGKPVKDKAERTIKYMDYDLTVDGYVTLPVGETSINRTLAVLRNLLTAQGGALDYRGRGFDLAVGPGNARDVAWGPVPELLEFQPLGAGRSAKVKWRVKTRVVDAVVSGSRSGVLLQFNLETAAIYNEDGYSSLHVRGTMEIPLKRTPTQRTRTLTGTVDDIRSQVEARVFAGIDLSRFHVTRREYSVSRDKRTLEFDIVAEEKPYMDLPSDCTIARGTYSVRPANAGMGLASWLCTLRATYVVRADRPRRVAWFAFLALLRLRMGQSNLGVIPQLQGGDQNPNRTALRSAAIGTVSPPLAAALFWREILARQNQQIVDSRRAWLIDFSFDEGLYFDSKTVSFSATWKLSTVFSHILLASGLWKKLPERDNQGDNLWATSIRAISGSQSWLRNSLDPRLDIIVDFGGS